MDPSEEFLQETITKLTIDTSGLRHIASDFCTDMRAGMAGQSSSLKLLPSFLDCPTGQENGQFLALDFGGTNVRALLVELRGGSLAVLRGQTKPLRQAGGCDYSSRESSAASLFDFLAGMVIAVAGPQASYDLGHTFSFPCQQRSVFQAELLSWTKEIATPGVEGQEVGALLTAALQRQGSLIVQRALINDTVATLLTAAYCDPAADIGSICGTGHNTCYRQPGRKAVGAAMIRNLESGNFSQIPITEYDELLDKASDKPGTQQLEKMVGGHYLGELVRLIARKFAAQGLLFIGCQPDLLAQPYTLSSADLAMLQASCRTGVPNALAGWQQGRDPRLVWRDMEILSGLAVAICRRSARLAAATFVGILQYLDPKLLRLHTVGIDGSLYQKMPYYAAYLQAALQELLVEQVGTVRVSLVKDGSGFGAAIAAALVAQGTDQKFPQGRKNNYNGI